MACENDFEENIESLRKLFRLNNMISFDIKQIKCSAGSSSGDNYMSVVKRIQISDTSGDRLTNQQAEIVKYEENELAKNHCKILKATKQLTLIIKRQIPSLSRRRLYRCDEAFSNEINAYKHIVPLLEQFTHTNDTFFPKCYFSGQDDMGEIIILEDLKELGFRMQNRLAGLELSYCELVMKQLAKLHAASIAAKQLNNEIFREKCKHMREIVYCKEAEEFYGNILETSIQESLYSLRVSNVDGSLTEPIRLIEQMQTQLFNKMQLSIGNAKESISVMCHGDLWINNIMFTDVSITEACNDISTTPAVKFFDLQAMRYTSPVFDILHFIYTSTKRDLRDAYTKRLLETYCNALSDNLENQFSTAADELEMLREIFSLRNITAEYYENVLYGLAISMWILPAVTFDPNNIPNLDAISEMNTNAKELKCTQKLTPEYHLRVKDLALEFYQNGWLTEVLFE